MTTPPTHPDPDVDDDHLFSGSDVDLTYDDSGDHSSREHSPEPDDNEHHAADDDDEHDESPSQLRRTTWIIIILSSFVLAFLAQTLLVAKREPEIMYSKEHKFRPAASPIITETLKDGRIRLRGATPPPPSKPAKTASPKKKKNRRRGRLVAKRRRRRKKVGTARVSSIYDGTDVSRIPVVMMKLWISHTHTHPQTADGNMASERLFSARPLDESGDPPDGPDFLSSWFVDGLGSKSIETTGMSNLSCGTRSRPKDIRLLNTTNIDTE